MKIKFNSAVIVNVVIALALVLLFISWGLLYWSTGSSAGFADITIRVNNLKPVDKPISDSIPYYQHKRLQDSVAQLRTLRNGDGQSAGSGAYVALWAAHRSNYCDTCKIQYEKNSSPSFRIDNKPTRNYFMLLGWKIAPRPVGLDSTIFHVEHGQAYLRKQMIDSIYKDRQGSVQKVAHTRDIPVSFAYNKQFNCIMIPIEPGTKKMLQIALTIVGISACIYFMFFVMGNFLKFLIDVARGQTFTERNIRRLKIIGISLLAIEALTFLLNLCMPLIFHSYFTSDVVLSEKSWDGGWKWLMAGITFLLLYKAFRSGKRIQDEQDLVI